MAGLLKGLRPHGALPWVMLSLLLSIGILSTALDYHHLPIMETRRAQAMAQRLVIDPITGEIAVTKTETVDHAFDVAPERTTAPIPSHASAMPEKPTSEVVVVEPPSEAPVEEAPIALNGLPSLRTQPLAPTPTKTHNAPLVPAPAPEITEIVNGVSLPKKGTGATASPNSIYAQHFTAAEKKPLLSLVVMNAGMSAQSDQLLLALPAQVTLALSPYAHEISKKIMMFREAGFESWAMAPVMTEHFPQADPGPLGLVASLPKEEITRRLQTLLSETLGVVGFVLPPDENLSSKPTLFAQWLTELTARGFYLLSTHPSHSIDSLTHDATLKPSLARADLMLDGVPDDSYIKNKLASLPAALKKKGSLIVILSARPQTLVLLQAWLKENGPDHVALAPLSAQWKAAETLKAEASPEKNNEKPEEKKPESNKKAEPEKKAEKTLEPTTKAETK